VLCVSEATLRQVCLLATLRKGPDQGPIRRGLNGSTPQVEGMFGPEGHRAYGA
jgi:hypothetical protein